MLGMFSKLVLCFYQGVSLLGRFWTLICICHYLTSSSSSLQGIAKASFVSALASFVVPFSHDARIAPSFIKDICCMMASK